MVRASWTKMAVMKMAVMKRGETQVSHRAIIAQELSMLVPKQATNAIFFVSTASGDDGRTSLRLMSSQWMVGQVSGL